MKRKCNAIQRLMSDYIDDVLTRREAARVETHVRSCRVCEHEVTTLKKTRELVLDFYVVPEVPESYYHQFEVELHQTLERMPPISLSHRLQVSIARCTWGLLTQCYQRFGRYLRGSRYALPRYALLLTFAAVMAVFFIVKQERHPDSVYPRDVSSVRETVLAGTSMEAKLRNRSYNESGTKRRAPTEVSPPSLAANTQEEGYWVLIEPLAGEAVRVLRKGDIATQQEMGTNRGVDLAMPNWQLGAGAQLTKSSMDLDIGDKKPLLQESRYAASPLEPQVTLFSEVYQRKRRSVPRFFNFKKLMDVPSEILAIPEVPIKL